MNNGDLQQWWFFAFMVAWYGPIIVLGIRANIIGRAYLRRLPPVDGVPLVWYIFPGQLRGWRSGWHGPVWRAWRQRQSDPELERLWQAGRRYGRYAVLWIFGFPFIFAGARVVVALIGTIMH